MMRFKGGPLDGVVNDQLGDEDVTAEWDNEKHVYEVTDEHGETRGWIQSEMFHEPRTPVAKRALLKLPRFWSLVLVALSFVVQVPTSFFGPEVRVFGYMSAWMLMFLAWTLK